MDDPLSSLESLQHLAYHVFLLPQLPQSELEKTADRQVRLRITRSVIAAISKYRLKDGNSDEWNRITRMLERLAYYIEVPLQKNKLSRDMMDMKVDDVLALYIRAQNAAIIIRKRIVTTVFEAFEVQAPNADVMSIPGKIVRYYPGPAVEVPNSAANDIDFVDEVASILAQMDTEEFEEAVATTRKAGSEVREDRDPNNPNYFVQLFFGILRGMGKVIEPPRVTKRIADEVLWDGGDKPWRRSPIWLIIRVAIQTSLSSKHLYKHFMAFYHMDILSESLQHEAFSGDLLYTMRVKMAKRVYKVRDSAPEFLVERVKTVAEDAQDVLRQRWAQVQDDQARSPNWNPGKCDFEASTNQTLPNSRAYLEQLFKGQLKGKERSCFMPGKDPRLEDISDFTVYADGKLAEAVKQDKHVALFDFEASVFRYLSAWTSNKLSNATSACKTIFSCFGQYAAAAQAQYTTDVADRSISILTFVKLWVAIDELATHAIPLLRDFSPELPTNLLDPLLLRTSEHIKQARVIQQYLRTRHDRALSKNSSIFSDNASDRHFANQYFRQSSDLQDLKSKIEDDAERKRERKLQELRERNEEHARLARQASQLTHAFVERYYRGRWRSDHSGSCERCAVEWKRDNLTITLHEWPLPSRSLEAEAVVFELKRPAAFTIWRDATYRILRALAASTKPDPVNPPVTLEGYSDLHPWHTSPDGVSSRVVMASNTHTFMRTHFSETSIPAQSSSVCVNNGLQYQLYDSTKHYWTEDLGKGAKLTFGRFGTLSLPENSPYKHLRYALEGTTHTTNQVLADQYDCPKDLSLHEHIAFGTLRSGPRLQWMNIARGIEENILTFSCLEVNLLHTQSAWQIGPLNDNGSREWHEELSKPEFGRLLVSQSNILLDRVKANWLEATSVSTAVLLVARLLVSSADAVVLGDAYQFLHEARMVTLKWMFKLQDKLKGATKESAVVDYQHRVCEMAAICRSTFDIDLCHIPNLLLQPGDFAALIKCSIAIHDNKPPDLKNSPHRLQVLLCRDQRLSHKILPYILQKLRTNQHVFSPPISDLWTAYQPSPDGWVEAPVQKSRWVSTNTAEVAGKASQSVHLNLLDGRLLISGEPLGRLPRQYVQHPTYIRVFGQVILDVVPASAPGMKFATRDQVDGYELSFLLKETNDDLVIQARKDNQTFQLIPYSRLAKDLPEFFSTDYHHWANLGEEKTIEFRPLSAPWSSAECQWVLSFHDNAITMKHKGSNSALVDIHSSLFHMVSLQLDPLESSRYMHATVSKAHDSQIQVELPRLRLSFFVNNDMQLESNNFCGNIVDPNRSTGTMFGLENQLVLIPRDPVDLSLPRSRSVLIPHGRVRFGKKQHHVSVTIDRGGHRHVSFHRFLIDMDLGNLMNEAGLTSRLYKIYLHALTSHCLPDPLTGRTGVEEALDALSESATSSFDQLDEEQARLLKLIGSLTPNRGYYPAHLKCMQTIKWSDLPSLSQHFAFSTMAATILERADTLQLFHPLDFNAQEFVTTSDTILLRRTALRTTAYYPSETSIICAEVLGKSPVKDTAHIGRDALDLGWVEAGQFAACAGNLAYQNWERPIYKRLDIMTLAESWDHLKGSFDGLNLAYTSDWLKLDLPECWITLYNLCRSASADGNKYKLSSCIASAAFSGKIPPDLLSALVAFASNRVFTSLEPPVGSHFLLTDGYQPTIARVQSIVASSTRDFSETPSARLSRRHGESYDELEERQQEDYQEQLSKYESELVRDLIRQWPSDHLKAPSAIYDSWFTVSCCLTSTQEYFSSCNRNTRLRDHLQKVEQALSFRPPSAGLTFMGVTAPLTSRPVVTAVRQDQWSAISVDNLMHYRPCPDTEPMLRPNIAMPKRAVPPTETSRLRDLFSEFEQSPQPLNRRYGRELDESRVDLANKSPLAIPKQLPCFEVLEYNRQSYNLTLKTTFRQLKDFLGPSTPIEHILSVCGVWSRITPRTLLQQLTLKARHRGSASTNWQREIMGYAQLFADYQLSQRLVALSHADKVDEFWKELNSAEADRDIAELKPDWLLVQIEGNFSARSIQREVAHEMMAPSSGSNTVLQLNMGEGKSSVIVPLIAASLADATQLVRVIVLKPLWRQMFHLLVNRLSGLVNRRIYYLPFRRDLDMDDSKAQQLQKLYVECMSEGGILLAQPEHILSFKLMGVEQLALARSQVTQSLQDTQNWLTKHARDILDESDEILHVRYQLVYTVGKQEPFEDHPDRWTTTQQILQLLARQISQLKCDHPESFKHGSKVQGSFPCIRIMPHCTTEAQEQLLNTLADGLLRGGIQNLNRLRSTPAVHSAVHLFITTKDFSHAEYEALKSNFDPTTWRTLLLFRGLLALGILVFTLKEKHYRVDYGLDVSRSQLAVPFLAKDIPSPRAEFGHPDVVIVLTCLCYYYKGLTEEQLSYCFELLDKLDNPALEYEQWVTRNESTPPDLRQLISVNLKDREQFTEFIIPTFSHNSAVVDFYLSSVVFPKAAKQFSHKLSTSGWDLAEKKPHLTTGFSGTNDNRFLLPTSITQADPVNQLSTNALVLTYLLQRENNHYICMPDSGSGTRSKDLLQILIDQKLEIRVLLDVGARILDKENEEFAKCWLELEQSPEVEAAVYFNKKDELMVLPRNGFPSSFHASPFSQQLEKCVVYLDDGHTRGTDLKLPRHARALVTLGPKVTKDRLLQGCMRMRKLGQGQSVMFVAPPEIDFQIRSVSPNPLSRDDKVDALDVLRWSMTRTCRDLKHHVSHWAQQGIEYARRAEAQRKYVEDLDPSHLEEGWITPEARTLERMYGIPSPTELSLHGNFTQRAFDIPAMRERLDYLGIKKLEDPSMDEEQEREVSHEVQKELQIERPPKGMPVVHTAHQDVERFIQTGCIPASSPGFVSLFHAFGPGRRNGWSKKLLASLDFAQTMEDYSSNSLSDYMRPVNWILQGSKGIRVALSPYEVNKFLPLIRDSNVVSLHIYAPRVTESMRSFSNLDFYSIPPGPKLPRPYSPSTTQLQLDLFAGQLYLSDYQEYTMLCAVLGIYTDPTGTVEMAGIEIDGDGFVKPEHREELVDYHPGYAICKFTSSPIPVLKELIGLRRKGMKYLPTNVGQILHARNLTQNDF